MTGSIQTGVSRCTPGSSVSVLCEDTEQIYNWLKKPSTPHEQGE